MIMGFDPQCYREAFHDPIWQETMDDKYDSLQDNKTWDLLSFTFGRNLVHCKWIYKNKLAIDGYPTKYKDQLVTKGCSQVHGPDYKDAFICVVRMDSISMVLAIVYLKRWEVHHMDVKSSFLHGDLKEEIYMKQPKGYIEDSSLVCTLDKYLYGIK